MLTKTYTYLNKFFIPLKFCQIIKTTLFWANTQPRYDILKKKKSNLCPQSEIILNFIETNDSTFSLPLPLLLFRVSVVWN